ncbi:MAG: ABC transporter ATP-binding protein [Chloroflexi bacterium]|nr:ABC transporter ATP-binding protein [Chloroflexota bacterium]
MSLQTTPAGAGPASDSPAATKLSFRNVTKGFDGMAGRTEALEDFNLEIHPGEFVCLVGPSGCGKTTALNLAAGFVRPDKGQVLLDGHPIERPGPDRAMIFQEHALFPWLTVRQNIEFGAKLAGKPKVQREVTANFYLRLVQLEKFANSFAHELSGGMKQRVQIARALALSPVVFLMDEPFAALDAITRDLLYAEVQHILADTKQTVLFITHNVREAVILGDRVVVMGGQNPGRIKAEFEVDLPRPRAFESPGVVELASRTLELLKASGGLEEKPGSEDI